MLGDHPDEPDGKHLTSSPLMSLGRKLGKMLPGHHSHSGSNDSLEEHKRKKKGKAKRKKSKDNSDPRKQDEDLTTGTSSEDSDTETAGVGGKCGAMSLAAAGEVVATPTRVEMQYASQFAASKCEEMDKLEDEPKAPGDGTKVHLHSPRSGQGDGLLQVTSTRLNPRTSESPVYAVNFKGKCGDRMTNMSWNFYKEVGCSCTRVFLDMVDPKDTEQYTFRLCLYKRGDEYMLAAHKAESEPVNIDLINICYHQTKGGMVTLQGNCCNSDQFIGTSQDGEVRMIKKSCCPGYCTNPFTLFYVYDEGSCEPTEDLKRMNGE